MGARRRKSHDRLRGRAVYLQPMAEPPSAATPPGQEPPERATADEAGEHERYGPLDVARHAKDDGRELILYTRRRDG